MKKETVKKILKETERGYDLIAEKFSQTRKNFWSDLEFIKNYARENDRILDYGCGNGRLAELFLEKNINYIGVDFSAKLIDLAKRRYTADNFKFLKINSGQASLPFSEDYFNVVYALAVFHHLPSEDLRRKMARELFHVVKPDGYIIVSVWNLFQKKYWKNILENWKNKIIRKSDLDWNDCYIGFTDNEKRKFVRYHHAFTRKGLEKLFHKAGFKTEKCAIINGRNIIFIGKK